MESGGISSETSLPTGRSKRIWKAFYLASLFGIPLLAVQLFLAAGLYHEADLEDAKEAIAQCWPYIFAYGLFTAVVSAVLLHRLWSALPAPFARMRPGAAVGRCCIPLYNVYWIYQAVWGWTADFDRFVQETRIPAPPMRRRVALILCISAPLAAIPYVNFVLLPIQSVLGLIFVARAIDGVNAVARAREEDPATAGDRRFRPSRFWLHWTGLSAWAGLTHSIVWMAADICEQLKRNLKFDLLKAEFVGDPEANRLRSRVTREPWCV